MSSDGARALLALAMPKGRHPLFGFIAKHTSGLKERQEDALLLAAYFGLGALVYGFVEGWRPLDSCYFMMVTATTVGFGDIAPATQLGRLFTTIYALLGITVVFGTLHPFITPAFEWLVTTAVRLVPALELKVSNSLTISLEEARQKVSYTRRYVQVMIPTIALLLLGIFLGFMMETVEHDRTLIDAIYFGVISMSTIGYGDMSPSSAPDKIAMMAFLPLATSALSKMLADFDRIAMNRRIREADNTTSESLSTMLLEEMASQEAGDDVTRISEAEFLIQCLRKNELVDETTIAAIRRQYKHVMSKASPEAFAESNASIGVRLVFERLDAEGRIGQRSGGVPLGAMDGVVRLVDRTAPDKGFGEWKQEHWTQRVAEFKARAYGKEEENKISGPPSPETEGGPLQRLSSQLTTEAAPAGYAKLEDGTEASAGDEELGGGAQSGAAAGMAGEEGGHDGGSGCDGSTPPSAAKGRGILAAASGVARGAVAALSYRKGDDSVRNMHPGAAAGTVPMKEKQMPPVDA